MRRLTLRASMALGVLAFWILIDRAARRFPGAYDWRYMTMSQLIYPERNPAGHPWASAALIACAGAGLIWLAALPETLRFRARAILATGYTCMILSALLPERWLSIRNGHEMLAIAGFISVCCGLVLLSLNARNPERGSSRLLPVSFALVAFSPIAMAGVTQAYLTWWRPELPWVGLAWRTMRVPLYLSFALWEWVTCALLSAYMAGVGLVVGEQTCRRSRC
jgi:hypothetical protein